MKSSWAWMCHLLHPYLYCSRHGPCPLCSTNKIAELWRCAWWTQDYCSVLIFPGYWAHDSQVKLRVAQFCSPCWLARAIFYSSPLRLYWFLSTPSLVSHHTLSIYSSPLLSLWSFTTFLFLNFFKRSTLTGLALSMKSLYPLVYSA